MTTAIATAADPKAVAVEQVLIQGDLSKLGPAERTGYLLKVCDSLRLNPLTRPFEFVRLSGREVLYAKKDATEQLRKRDRVSVQIVGRELVAGVYVVTARATLPDGRCDESVGAVPLDGLRGEAAANAMMKAETKAKRRVTLSICGLGMLDESEVADLPREDVRPAADPVPALPATPPEEVVPGDPLTDRAALDSLLAAKGVRWPSVVANLNAKLGRTYSVTRTKWLDIPRADREIVVAGLHKLADATPPATPAADSSGAVTSDALYSQIEDWARLTPARQTGPLMTELWRELKFEGSGLDDLTPAELAKGLEYARGKVRLLKAGGAA